MMKSIFNRENIDQGLTNAAADNARDPLTGLGGAGVNISAGNVNAAGALGY